MDGIDRPGLVETAPTAPAEVDRGETIPSSIYRSGIPFVGLVSGMLSAIGGGEGEGPPSPKTVEILIRAGDCVYAMLFGVTGRPGWHGSPSAATHKIRIPHIQISTYTQYRPQSVIVERRPTCNRLSSIACPSPQQPAIAPPRTHPPEALNSLQPAPPKSRSVVTIVQILSAESPATISLPSSAARDRVENQIHCRGCHIKTTSVIISSPL